VKETLIPQHDFPFILF